MDVKLEFNPAIHGFKFTNTFQSRGPINTAGLCGGMCLAAFNYFRYNIPIPYYNDRDLEDRDQFTVEYDLLLRTDQNTLPMMDYIFHSQIATFSNSSIVSFIGVEDPVFEYEFDKIAQRINQNTYVIVGLKGKPDLAHHQVLCYGYNGVNRKLFVYDPNNPFNESIIENTIDGLSITSSDGIFTSTSFKALFEAQELYKEKISNRVTYDAVDNVIRNLNYAVIPPIVENPLAVIYPPDVDLARSRMVNSPYYIYKIVSEVNALVLDVQDDVFEKGTQIRQCNSHNGNFTCDGKNQLWIFIFDHLEGGLPTYRILNYGFRKYLTFSNNSVQANVFSEDPNQLWYMIYSTENHRRFYLKSVANGKYLYAPISNDNFIPYSILNLDDSNRKRFCYQDVVPSQNGIIENIDLPVFLTTSYNKNIVIDIPYGAPDNGTTVNIYSKFLSNTNQAFFISRTSEDGLYKICSQTNHNQCLEAINNKPTFNNSHDIDEQKWYFITSIRDNRNTYFIINKATGKVLTVNRLVEDSGTPIKLTHFKDLPNQKWYVEQFS